MTTPSINIERLKVEGFRAYLQAQTISLARGSTPLSLAVFAPNAGGKSSLVDSLEFYFSEDATLHRLGKRTFQSHAGPLAIEHVDATERGVKPSVHLWFRQGSERFDAERPASGNRTEAAERVISAVKVPFIIRGYELRGFVEETTPGERYKELAGWFALDPLLSIQQSFRSLRSQVKQRLDSTSEVDERSRDLKRATKNSIPSWDETAVIAWFNKEILGPLDNSLGVEDISSQDPAVCELKKQKEAELEQTGVGQLTRNLGFVEALIQKPGTETVGHIAFFERAVANRREAVGREAEERAKASNAVFNQVWEQAKTLFDDNVDFDACPVCETDFRSSPLGTREAVYTNLTDRLTELRRYREARQGLEAAETGLKKAKESLSKGLETAVSALEEEGHELQAFVAYSEALKSWEAGEEAPGSSNAIGFLQTVHSSISADIDRVNNQQSEHTYGKAFSMLEELVTIKSDLKRIERTKQQLGMLLEELTRQTHAINKDIVDHTQALISSLQAEVARIYGEIQGGVGAAPPIRIELPEENERDQQHAQLVIDFSANRQGVVPSGYLSDSQVHTLALALRLAAIRLLNLTSPIIVLDDIVTSYDADHRKNIAAVLANHFGEFQIILVTHDEQFFSLLKDQLPEGRWAYKRIMEVRPGFGPVFHDHKTTDQDIQAKLDANQSAAAEIRQAEEEWLLQICREFGTKVVLRPPERAFQYDRGELADSLGSFLKGIEISIPEVQGVSGSFLSSLQKGVVENLGSHHSDNPYKSGSVGDDKARWAEFKTFRDLFKCASCGKMRFRRPPTLEKPVCASCQAPFQFSSSHS